MSSDLDALAKNGSLGDRRVAAYLDTLDLAMVMGVLGAGIVATDYAAPSYQHGHDPRTRWHQGDGRPGLADDDPATITALGRCALARWAGRPSPFGAFATTSTHDQRCGWCEYPDVELQRALDWSVWASRFITDEWMVWTREGRTYRRQTGRAGRYENPRWQVFATLSPGDQKRAVDAAVDASRAMLVAPASVVVAPPVRDHEPWCDQPDDHPGDCPNPTEDD